MRMTDEELRALAMAHLQLDPHFDAEDMGLLRAVEAEAWRRAEEKHNDEWNELVGRRDREKADMGDRIATLTSVLAVARAEVERLRARVRELEDTQWGGDDEMPERDDDAG